MLKTPPALLALFASLAVSASAQTDQQLDQVLAELKSLRQEVSELSARVEELEGKKLQPAETAPEVQPRERKSWFDNMRVELKKAEVRASGAWTTPSVWDGIETGLTEEEVLDILGEPTMRKFSVRKDTDEILFYQGDLEGSGEMISGEIRIYKGKVRRFNSPDFPSEG